MPTLAQLYAERQSAKQTSEPSSETSKMTPWEKAAARVEAFEREQRMDPSTGVAGDMGRMVGVGLNQLADSGGYLLEKMGMERAGRWVQDKAQQRIQDLYGELTPEQQAANQLQFTRKEDGEFGIGPAFTSPRALVGQVAASAPAMGFGMGLGGVVTRSLAAAGAGRVAAAGVGYGAGEGAIAGGLAGKDMVNEIRNAPIEALRGTEPFRLALESLAGDEGLSPENREALTREKVATAAYLETAGKVGLATAILSAPSGVMFDKLLRGAGLTRSAAPSLAKDLPLYMAGEGLQEFPQEGAESIISGQAAEKYVGADPKPWSDHFEQAVAGGVTGAVTGGMMGGPAHVAGAMARRSAPPAPPENGAPQVPPSVDERTAEVVRDAAQGTPEESWRPTPLALPAPAVTVTPDGTAVLPRQLDDMVNARLNAGGMSPEQIGASRRKLAGMEAPAAPVVPAKPAGALEKAANLAAPVPVVPDVVAPVSGSPAAVANHWDRLEQLAAQQAAPMDAGGVTDGVSDVQEEVGGAAQEVPAVRVPDVAPRKVRVKAAQPDWITFDVDGADVTLAAGPNQSPQEFAQAVQEVSGLPISQAFVRLRERFGQAADVPGAQTVAGPLAEAPAAPVVDAGPNIAPASGSKTEPKAPRVTYPQMARQAKGLGLELSRKQPDGSFTASRGGEVVFTAANLAEIPARLAEVGQGSAVGERVPDAGKPMAESAGNPLAVGDVFELDGVEYRLEALKNGAVEAVDEDSGAVETWPNLEAFERQTGRRVVDRGAAVDAVAHEAATSPENDLPEPTQAQKEAGNYKKGHVKIHGLDISIENPKGSDRSGVDPDGKPWSVKMPAHYGYVKRTEGADGDHVDVYIGPNPESARVFIVDQRDHETGKFDEHKIILGVDGLEQAASLYMAGFSDGLGGKRLGALTEMSVDGFRQWLKDGDTSRPLEETIRAESKSEPVVNDSLTTEAEAPALVKVPTVYGESVFVRRRDLDGDKTILPIFTKDGNRRDNVVHRDNIDLDGSKRKAKADEIKDMPTFAVISAKGDKAFASAIAAQREVNRLGLKDSHEVVRAEVLFPGTKGYVGRRKGFDGTVPKGGRPQDRGGRKATAEGAAPTTVVARGNGVEYGVVAVKHPSTGDAGYSLRVRMKGGEWAHSDNWAPTVEAIYQRIAEKRPGTPSQIETADIVVDDLKARRQEIEEKKATAERAKRDEKVRVESAATEVQRRRGVALEAIDAVRVKSRRGSVNVYMSGNETSPVDADIYDSVGLAIHRPVWSRTSGFTVTDVRSGLRAFAAMSKADAVRFVKGFAWRGLSIPDSMTKPYDETSKRERAEREQFGREALALQQFLNDKTEVPPEFWGAVDEKPETVDKQSTTDALTERSEEADAVGPNHPVAKSLVDILQKIDTITSRTEAAAIEKAINKDIYGSLKDKQGHSTLAYRLSKRAEDGLRAALSLNDGTSKNKESMHRGQVDAFKESLREAIAVFGPGYGAASDGAADLATTDKDGYPVISPDDLPTAEIVSAYSHTSNSPRAAAEVEQRQYVEFMQELKDDMLEDLPAGNEELLAAELGRVKGEYLTRRKRVLTVRSHTVSSLVAGRSKFNSKQAEQRGSALDKAEADFADWQRRVSADVAEAVGVAEVRTEKARQKAERKQAAREEADRREKEQRKAEIALPIINQRGEGVKEITREEWSKTGKDYKSIIVSGDGTYRYRSMMTQGGLTPVFITDMKVVEEPGAEQAAAETVDAGAYGVEAHTAFFKRLADGDGTAAEIQANFQAVIDNKEAIVAELSAMKKDDLLNMLGGMSRRNYKNDKKDAIVRAVYEDMQDDFVLGRGYSYSLGAGSKLAAIKKIVDGLTDADVAAHAKSVETSRQEAKEWVESRVKAMADPQSLDDFAVYLRGKMADGMSEREARLSLSPEQRTRFDALRAAESRKNRTERKTQQKATLQVAGQTVAGSIIETKHTKKGHDLFVVQLAERVERDDYNALNASAKKLGGYYSSFRGGGAVPGFQFTSREDAEAFVQLAGGDASAAKAAVTERMSAFEDDRTQGAAERLNAMADALEKRADESLGRERKANTQRRAGMAARAEAAANADKALAQTMRNLAAAIESGDAEFLDRVREKKQVEYLTSVLRLAKWNEAKIKYPTQGERDRHENGPPTAETADYADYPTFTAFRSDLAALGRKLEGVEGLKQLGQRLLKVADDVTDAYVTFAKANLYKVSTFARKDGEGAMFASRQDAEAAIARSGYKGQAIVLPFKRGQNLIVLSPAEAQRRGVWEGDGDKRITLSADFGAELMEKLGRAAKRNRDLSVPWQFESVMDRRKMLSRMGIETAAEFRSALREFAGLQEQTKEPDRVKELERQMLGRKNDGLDFFPTPQSVADEMVAAADIQEGMAVLEPSAGWGHIAERIRESGHEPEVVELSNERKELLEAKGFNVVGRDFLEINPRDFTWGDIFRAKDGKEGRLSMTPGWELGSERVALKDEDGDAQGYYDRSELEPVRKDGANSGYDRIIMNPPFSDRRDIQHVYHAYDLLKPGGRLVAIMSEGVFFGQDKKASAFRDWVEAVGGTDEKLEQGVFNDPSLPVNTGVAARMVVIDKQAGVEAPKFSVAELYMEELERKGWKFAADGSAPASYLTGDSGLGEVSVAPARVLPFLRNVLDAENLEAVSVSGGNVDGLREVGKLFGKRIVFFRERDGGRVEPGRGGRGEAPRSGRAVRHDAASGDLRRGTVNGFMLPSRPDVIYLNVHAPDSLLRVLGHELGHSLRVEDAALWGELVKGLQPLVRNWSDFKAAKGDARYANLSDDALAEELFGDVIGENFLNELFWRDMAQANESLFKRVAKKAVALLSKALRALTGRAGVERYVSDMTQARAVVAKVLSQYGERAALGQYERFAKQEDGDYLSGRIDGKALLARMMEMGHSLEDIARLVEGTRYAAESATVEGTDTAKFSVAQTAQDRAKAQAAFAKTLTADRAGAVFKTLGSMVPERMKAAVGSVLSNPHYESRKSKWRGAAYELALERGANANEIKHEVMATDGDYEGLEGVRDHYRKASKAERAMIDKLLVEGDIRGEEYSVEDLWSRNNPLDGAVPQVVGEAYLAFRRTLDKSTKVMFDRLGRLRLLPYEGSEFYQELIDLLDAGLSADAVRRRFGINEKAVDAYMRIRADRKKLDEATKPYRDQPWHDTLRDAIVKGLGGLEMQNEFGKTPDLVAAFREIQKNGPLSIMTAEKFKKAQWYSILSDLLTQGDAHPMLKKLELYNAYLGVKEYDSQLAKLKDQWGQVKGYLPRIRKDGEQHVKVYRVEEDGTFTEVWMQPAKSVFGAKRLQAKVMKDLKGYIPHSFDPDAQYEVVVEPNTATPEEIFMGIGSHRAIEGLLSKVFDRATDAGLLENRLEVQNQVLRILADEISSRGFGRHKLHRAEHLIEGYETENTPAILAQFIGGMAGWLSKSEFAMRANKLMGEIPATRPEDKTWVREYVDDALKNSTWLDQWFGTARSFAALMYLGFKASSAILNATQNYVWGQAVLSKHTGGATAKLLKAQADVLRDHLLTRAGKDGVLTEEERWVLEEGLRRGRSHANYVRAMSGLDDNGGVLGKGQAGIRWLTEKAMIPFQAVETYWNREPALLAAYRVFRAQGLEQDAALAKAEKFVDDVHFVVSKENIPGLLRKMGPVGRTLYTFQSYSHNYLLGMFHAMKDGEAAVVMRSLTALVLFGGLAAMPFGDDLDKWYRRVFGERPLRMLEKWLKETAGEYTDFGDQIADFVIHGAPALAGVNFSRALGVNVSFLSAEDDTLAERLGGVWGGLAQKVQFGAMAAAKGDAFRAAEFMAPEALANLMRSYRHYADGATTLSGRPVFGDDGKQLKYTAGESVIRAFGFMPIRPSKQTEKRWDARSAREFWNDRKGDILAQWRRAPGDKKVLEQIRKFNRDLRDAPARPLVSAITPQTLRRALKDKPNRGEMLY